MMKALIQAEEKAKPSHSMETDGSEHDQTAAEEFMSRIKVGAFANIVCCCIHIV